MDKYLLENEYDWNVDNIDRQQQIIIDEDKENELIDELIETVYSIITKYNLDYKIIIMLLYKKLDPQYFDEMIIQDIVEEAKKHGNKTLLNEQTKLKFGLISDKVRAVLRLKEILK